MEVKFLLQLMLGKEDKQIKEDKRNTRPVSGT